MGNLNPMPVMGPEAFKAFAREWSDYLIENGERGKISVRSQRNPYNKGNINVYYAIANFIGGYKGGDNRGNIICNVRDGRKENFGELEECSLSPIVFTDLAILTPDRIGEINELFKKEKISLNPEELLETTKKMIYERSALVHRGLFGGYSI